MSERSSRRPAGMPGWPLVAGVFVVVAMVAIHEATVRRGGPAPHRPQPLPELSMVEGWIGAGDGPPTTESLRGRYVVLDAWATWCGPCRSSLPGLAGLHDRWAGRGVAFVGATSESGNEAAGVMDYLASLPSVTWPIAYGAEGVWDALSIREIPTLILFAPDGMSVWRGHSITELERELDRRLAAAPGGETPRS